MFYKLGNAAAITRFGVTKTANEELDLLPPGEGYWDHLPWHDKHRDMLMATPLALGGTLLGHHVGGLPGAVVGGMTTGIGGSLLGHSLMSDDAKMRIYDEPMQGAYTAFSDAVKKEPDNERLREDKASYIGPLQEIDARKREILKSRQDQ